MFEQKLFDTINREKNAMCKMLDNDENCFMDLVELISTNGITEKTYARVFRLMFYFKESNQKISFDPIEKVWIRGNEPISDMETISLFAEAVRVIRLYIDYSWHSCQLNAMSAAWLSNKEYEKTVAALKAMESFSKIKSCLKISAEIMPSEEQDTAKIDWTKYGGDDEENEDPPLEASE